MVLMMLALVLVRPGPYSDQEPSTPVSPRLWKGLKPSSKRIHPNPYYGIKASFNIASEKRVPQVCGINGSRQKQRWAQESDCQTLTLSSDYVFN